MSLPARKTLTTLIALALACTSGWAQEDAPEEEQSGPSLYTSVDEVSVYLIKPDGSQVDVETGEAVVIKGDTHQYIDRRPSFLEWPCGTGLAEGRGTQEDFTIEDLGSGNVITQVVQRWFEEQRVLKPRVRWLNGDVHTWLPVEMIEEYLEEGAFWYRTGPATDKMAALRPKTLIISLFYGTGQVVVDTNHLEELKAEYPGGDIPVAFEYQDENVVPVSYFGYQPDPALLLNAFLERGVRAADVPMQFGGDYHMDLATKQLVELLGAPPLDEISPQRRATLERELRERGFKGKAVNLSFIAGSAAIVADEAEKVRVAESIGIDSIPVMFNFFTDYTAALHCGVAPPVGAVGALGLMDPGGEIPPDPIPAPSAQTEPPPEITLPDPPQPEQPVSGN